MEDGGPYPPAALTLRRHKIRLKFLIPSGLPCPSEATMSKIAEYADMEEDIGAATKILA